MPAAALLINTSIGPPRAATASGTMRARSSGSERSAATTSTRSVWWRHFAKVSLRLPARWSCLSTVRAVITRAAPAAASRSAIPAPIPRLAPVTITRRPASSPLLTLARSRREPVAVRHRQELEELAVGIAHEDRDVDVGVGEDLAAELDHAGARGGDVVDAERDVGETRLVHHPLVGGRRAEVGVVQQFEHEAVAAQVRAGRTDRRPQSQQPVGRVVGHLEVEPGLEAERLDVEAPRPFEVAHAMADVVERAHGRDRTDGDQPA